MLDVGAYVEGRQQPAPMEDVGVTAAYARWSVIMWGSITIGAVQTFAHLESVIGFSHLVSRWVGYWRYYGEVVWRWLADLIHVDLPLGMGNVLTFVVFMVGLAFAGVRWRKADWEADVRAIAHFLGTTMVVVVALIYQEGEVPRISLALALGLVLGPFVLYPFAGAAREALSRCVYVLFLLLIGLTMVMVPLSGTQRHAKQMFDIAYENDGGDLVAGCMLDPDEAAQQACVDRVTTPPSIQTSFLAGMCILYCGMFALPFFVRLGYLNRRLLFVSLGVLLLLGFNQVAVMAETAGYGGYAVGEAEGEFEE